MHSAVVRAVRNRSSKSCATIAKPLKTLLQRGRPIAVGNGQHYRALNGCVEQLSRTILMRRSVFHGASTVTPAQV
ncbi:hypothetical protein [Pseudomonas sp. FME51]|uniref:hypothetical protein n=1 Tax=Pseudomonas sp. FME51 TaxID=2742609 RepID=UPI001866DDD0|nr:hypothetical protein [Pseudomonas sp. FME51]